MNLLELWNFPVPSNCINSGVSLTFSKGDAMLLFDYFDEDIDDKVFNGGLIFETSVAHRHSSEKFTKYVSGTYDKLVEMEDSHWLKELTNISPEWAKQWEIKHFAIYLDGYGLYEFIATGYKLIDTKEGALKEGY